MSEDGKITVSSLPFLLYTIHSANGSQSNFNCAEDFTAQFQISSTGGGARCDEKKLQQPARRQNADRVVKVLKPNVKTLNHQQMMVFIF